MKSFIANTIVKWFKRLGFAGAVRFRILYWMYQFTGWHIRQYEWDWVLNYLPKVNEHKLVRVLDVGATSSLFLYELRRRRYKAIALDIRPYQEKINDFILCDIRNYTTKNKFNFIVCISVIEHIQSQQELVLNKMIEALMPGGRLLITTPTKEYGQGLGYPRGGFNYQELEDMINPFGKIIEYTERGGQICVCITK